MSVSSNRTSNADTNPSGPRSAIDASVLPASAEPGAQFETASSWHQLAADVLDGQSLTVSQGLAILRCADEQVLDVLSAAFRIRRHYFGKTVQLYFLMNAKSGLCPEDCGYCSQSKVSEAEIPKYNILSRDALLDGARIAAERGAKTYCIVISARGPNEREMQAVETIVPEIKQQYDLDICACLGLLTPEQAGRLQACGVNRVNHNLNTSEEHYSQICTTHSYQDRLSTLQAVRDAGMELCSGGIIGMGESDEDVVKMAFALRELQVESIPLNFLNPIAGTPLGEGLATLPATNGQASDGPTTSGQEPTPLTPTYCLKALALYRFANPSRELRIAGGRELHLGCLQPLGLYAANSIFVGDYLTTRGQAPDADYRMIRELGFEVTTNMTANTTANTTANMTAPLSPKNTPCCNET